VRCVRLIDGQLHRSTVILRRAAATCDERLSWIANKRCVTSTAQVLWTDQSRELAVAPTQVNCMLSSDTFLCSHR